MSFVDCSVVRVSRQKFDPVLITPRTQQVLSRSVPKISLEVFIISKKILTCRQRRERDELLWRRTQLRQFTKTQDDKKISMARSFSDLRSDGASEGTTRYFSGVNVSHHRTCFVLSASLPLCSLLV